MIISLKGTLLVTGFEPFGSDDFNPSGEVAKRLDGKEVGECRVQSRILPVEWGTVKKVLTGLVDDLDPVVVLSLGLAGGSPSISVEKVAVNYTAEAKDNAGKIPEERAICRDGADAYFATIPAEKIVSRLVQTKIPARLTFSAGTYLCNYAFYTAACHVKTAGKRAKVGFVHVPATPEMVAGKTPRPSMNLDTVCDAVLSALETTVETLTNCG